MPKDQPLQSRAYPRNRDVLKPVVRTRAEIAMLLGYTSWADYNAADKIIGSGRNIAEFIEQLGASLRSVPEREFAMLLAEKHKTNPKAAEIPGYDYFHLLELVRRSQYAFDSQSVRPYLPYNQVKKGIMDTAATLFRVTFRQKLKAPAWDPTVVGLLRRSSRRSAFVISGCHRGLESTQYLGRWK